MSEQEPTKTSTSFNTENPNILNGQIWTTEEFEAKHSVELTQNAKGEFRVSVVKIYHNDPEEAARIAVNTAKLAHEALETSGLPKGN